MGQSNPVQLTGSNATNDGSVKTVGPSRLLQTIGTPTKLTIPTYDGSGQGVEPDVIFIPGGFGASKWKYWMAFTPYPNGDATKENVSVVCSTDGVNWVVPTGGSNPIQQPTGFPNNTATNRYQDPTIVYEYNPNTGGYNRLAVYYNDNSTGHMMRTTSNDGVTWATPVQCTASYYASSKTDLQSGVGIVFNGPGDWEAFHGTNFLGLAEYKTGELVHLVSSDGIAWTQKIPGLESNVRGYGLECNTHADALGYHMVMQAYPQKQQYPTTELYYAYSPTGDAFTFDYLPIIGKAQGTWYSQNVYRGSIIPWGNGVYRVYFSASDDNTNWNIGYVDCKLQVGSVPQKPKRISRCYYWELAVTDTSVHNPSPLVFNDDIFTYQNKVIHITSTLNQSVTLSLWDYPPTGNPAIFQLGAAKTQQSVTIPASCGKIMLTASDLAILSYCMGADLSMWQIQASTAPTSGNFTMIVEAWDN